MGTDWVNDVFFEGATVFSQWDLRHSIANQYSYLNWFPFLNDYLNRFTANATGLTVLAGPQECTALGNIMLQAKAAGVVDGIFDMRRMIASSITPKRFEPQDRGEWDKAYEKYLQVCG